MIKQKVSCNEVQCFGNTGRGRCRILRDTQGYENSCPFFKESRDSNPKEELYEMKKVLQEYEKERKMKKNNVFYWR